MDCTEIGLKRSREDGERGRRGGSDVSGNFGSTRGRVSTGEEDLVEMEAENFTKVSTETEGETEGTLTLELFTPKWKTKWTGPMRVMIGITLMEEASMIGMRILWTMND